MNRGAPLAGFLLAIVMIVAGAVLIVAGLGGAFNDSQGREWSMKELYECELAPSCDEEAAAEESRMAAEHPGKRDAAAAIFFGLMLVLGSIAVGNASSKMAAKYRARKTVGIGG